MGFDAAMQAQSGRSPIVGRSPGNDIDRAPGDATYTAQMSSAITTAARQLANAVLLPWWGLSLLSSAKSFADHPLIGSPRLVRMGLHGWRLRQAHALTGQRRERLRGLVAASDAIAFERDGFVVRPDVLPKDQFERLRDAVLARARPAREMLQGDTITRRIAVDADLRLASPDLAQLLDGPLWNGLTRYVGAYDAPAWAQVQTILSHTRDAAPDPQTHLHADTFHPTMKAWYFLTDVAIDEGPFSYVPGSHRLTAQRLEWEQRIALQAATAQLEDRYSRRGSFRIGKEELPGLDLPPPKLLAVPANTLVVADTFGFHARGPSARPTKRIEIWGFDRRNPFLPGTTDFPLRWLGQMENRSALYWQAMDRLEKLGFKRNPWRDAGMLRPDAPAASRDS